MTTQPQNPWMRRVGASLGLVVLAAALLPFSPQITRAAEGMSLHAPRWELWGQISPVLQLHIAAALTALAIGTVLMLRPKGRGLHKALGWTWVAAMSATAISSFFITGLNGDLFSLIHLLSGWTVIALPMAVYAIRNRNVERHRRGMSGLFFGGLVIAGLFTFIPGRFMFEMFFG
jgi:uncharacterized membrane protein